MRLVMQVLVAVTAALACLAFSPGTAFAEWPVQSCSHRHRIPVTITATGGGHTSETRIDLVDANFPASYAFTAAGNDVRVFRANDLTPVDFVVAGWDGATRSATIYVRLPTIPSGTSELVYIYIGDTAIGSAETASAVFPNVGVRLHSKISSANPTSPATALSFFQSAAVDVDNSVRPSVTGLNNRSLGGSNSNFGWCVSAVLNVTPATAGLWEFRYGGDFGRGGHLYVAGQELEEQWNDNLWWAGNYANTGETLEGSITLPAGWHRYEALGFEDCCDGPVGFQARAPGGAWQDLSSSNFDLRASQCVAETATVSVGTAESCVIDLVTTKSSVIDASSSSNFAIPGSIVRYNVEVENQGQEVDTSTLVITDLFPAEVALVTSGAGAFVFTDGPVSSGLSFTYGGPASTTDSVEFSVDGTDYSYIPASPVDASVTHVRFRPTGAMSPNQAGSKPSFSVSLLGQIL